MAYEDNGRMVCEDSGRMVGGKKRLIEREGGEN